MFNIEPGIKFGKIGIAAIAKNTFNKIQVTDQVARCEEMDLHCLLGFLARYLRTNNRTQQQRNKHLCRIRQSGSKRYRQQLIRRVECPSEHIGKGILRDRFLVAGNRQATFTYMKRTLRGTTVTGRVMQYALRYPVAGYDIGMKFILAHRQGQLPCHAMSIQHKGLRWQHRYSIQSNISEIALQEVLYP